MALVRSTQVVLAVVSFIEVARLHQETVHTQVLNEDELAMLPLSAKLQVLTTAQNIVFVMNRWVDPCCAGSKLSQPR
jgi:hypothetical protein